MLKEYLNWKFLHFDMGTSHLKCGIEKLNKLLVSNTCCNEGNEQYYSHLAACLIGFFFNWKKNKKKALVVSKFIAYTVIGNDLGLRLMPTLFYVVVISFFKDLTHFFFISLGWVQASAPKHKMRTYPSADCGILLLLSPILCFSIKHLTF